MMTGNKFKTLENNGMPEMQETFFEAKERPKKMTPNEMFENSQRTRQDFWRAHEEDCRNSEMTLYEFNECDRCQVRFSGKTKFTGIFEQIWDPAEVGIVERIPIPTVKDIVRGHAPGQQIWNGMPSQYALDKDTGEVVVRLSFGYEPGKRDADKYRSREPLPEFFNKRRPSMFSRKRDRQAAFEKHVPQSLKAKIRKTAQQCHLVMDSAAS